MSIYSKDDTRSDVPFENASKLEGIHELCSPSIDRRRMLHLTGAAGVAACIPSISSTVACAAPAANLMPKLQYSLNTSTIHGQEVELVEQIRIAAESGYDAIEFWLRDIEKYLASGGKVNDLRKIILDSGLHVAGSIAFSQWIVDDDSSRQKGLEQAAKDMELIRGLGGRRIAAPPSGATVGAKLDLNRIADRYRDLIEVGRSRDVAAQLEIWGFSKNLSTLGDVLFVAAATGHPDACILPDIYHLHKGGSNFTDLGLVAGSRIHVFHVNDFPSEPKREDITDAHRVYPGDGVAPLTYAIQTLIGNGFRGTLSLELFNREYWRQDPRMVAKVGLAKMKSAVELAMAST